MKYALVIIDMLNDFFDRNPRLKKLKKALCKNSNELIRFARQKKVPVIWIRQEFKSDLSDAFLIMRKKKESITIKGTKGCKVLEELNRNKNDKIIIKKRYSAFFKTSLNTYLRNRKIDTLILLGINTHACVRTTAIDAYQNDYEIIIAKDCVNSWDKDHHKITLEYLKGAMGIEIFSNNQIKRKIR
ncbi:MAG: isochorismatase family cysteine hydrolase [Nanoarchaeota archaeon]